jgi:hypothetical protein
MKSNKDTVNEVKKWLGCFGKKRLLCIKEMTGHMRRIIYASPSICFNSSIEYFAFNLFKYTFPNENQILEYTDGGIKTDDDDDSFQHMLKQNLLKAKKQVLHQKEISENHMVHETTNEPVFTTDPVIPMPSKDSVINDDDIKKRAVFDKKNIFFGNFKSVNEQELSNKNNFLETVKLSVTCETVLTPWGSALKIILKHWNTIFSLEN